MSRDAKYVIQLEGPFGDDEIAGVFSAMPPQTFESSKQVLGYDTLIVETKWSRDEEVIAAAKKSSPIQILRRNDDDFWIEIWNIRNKENL